ncbi:restriction endonuclease [Vibrio crassostreae]|uniref:restriction endonuclease n=1 Tax=Vibrio crassostreae TaxID=246167 RepID=UPI000F4966BF|nr:restriction endonuclease [Vibrio crassostreae]ROO74482.1 restriction system protein [Vibrio crassostreae]RPF59885.1 restriction system protein [Vibrio crassostreae]TCV61828.1 restriction system protein [Vibrio crassostreae]
MTIVEAIKLVMRTEKTPMSSKTIYELIIARNLYSFGALDPKGIVNRQIRKHCFGLDFPSASPVKHFEVIDSSAKAAEYYLYEANTLKKKSKNYDVEVVTFEQSNNSDLLPEERLHNAHKEHRKSLKEKLLEQVLSSEPAFFEQLVVDLLLAMGYGGNNPDAGIVRGGPGDGGIDGIIKEDKLGLDRIYIQAKRYNTANKIGERHLRDFAGAMVNVSKGVFITTSCFARTAYKYIDKHEKNIVLIDGDQLCDLMIDHGVGVSTVRSYSTFKVDADYFVDTQV